MINFVLTIITPSGILSTLYLLILAPFFLLSVQIVLLVNYVFILFLVKIFRVISLLLVSLTLDSVELLLLRSVVEGVWLNLAILYLLFIFYFLIDFHHMFNLISIWELILKNLTLLHWNLLNELFTHIFYGLGCIFLLLILLLTIDRKHIFIFKMLLNPIYFWYAAIFLTSFSYAAACILNQHLVLVLWVLIAI